MESCRGSSRQDLSPGIRPSLAVAQRSQTRCNVGAPKASIWATNNNSYCHRGWLQKSCSKPAAQIAPGLFRTTARSRYLAPDRHRPGHQPRASRRLPAQRTGLCPQARGDTTLRAITWRFPGSHARTDHLHRTPPSTNVSLLAGDLSCAGELVRARAGCGRCWCPASRPWCRLAALRWRQSGRRRAGRCRRGREPFRGFAVPAFGQGQCSWLAYGDAPAGGGTGHVGELAGESGCVGEPPGLAVPDRSEVFEGAGSVS
jgi:hypothetical protein